MFSMPETTLHAHSDPDHSDGVGVYGAHSDILCPSEGWYSAYHRLALTRGTASQRDLSSISRSIDRSPRVL